MSQISNKLIKYARPEFLIIGTLLIFILVAKQITDQITVENKVRETAQNRSISFQSQADSIRSTFYDSFGNIIYRISATKQTQLNDTEIEMIFPEIEIYDSGIATWKITAKKADLEKGKDFLLNKSAANIKFSGGVILKELTEMATALTVTTEELYFDSIQKEVSTSLEANVTGHEIMHTAKGLFADLKNNQLEFLSKNRGEHANSRF